MVTINTTDDLLRLLDANEQFRAAVRNKILTEDLIRLPSEFEEFKKDTEDFQSETRTDLGDLKRLGLESRLQTVVRARLASSLLLGRTRVLRATDESRGNADFTDAILMALENDVISKHEQERLFVTDMIMRAERHNSPGETLLIAVEASYKVETADLRKVRTSADALRKIFPDAEVKSALYFTDISEQDRSSAAADEMILLQES